MENDNMEQMKKQQQWVKDLMFNTIVFMSKNRYNGDFLTTGYKYAINGAIDNYSLTYFDEKKGTNISMFQRYAYFDQGIYKNILMSKNAYEIMSDSTRVFQSRTETNNELKKELHGEHLTPQSYTRKLLHQVYLDYSKNPSISEEELRRRIDYAFSDAKYCIITKNSEREYLDGKGKKYSKENINDFLRKYKIYKKDLSPREEDAFREMEGKSCRTDGFGSLRLFILMENGVKFVNANGKKQSFEECMLYLEDENYTI